MEDVYKKSFHVTGTLTFIFVEPLSTYKKDPGGPIRQKDFQTCTTQVRLVHKEPFVGRMETCT